MAMRSYAGFSFFGEEEVRRFLNFSLFLGDVSVPVKF